jgi:hypothetical protein
VVRAGAGRPFSQGRVGEPPFAGPPPLPPPGLWIACDESPALLRGDQWYYSAPDADGDMRNCKRDCFFAASARLLPPEKRRLEANRRHPRAVVGGGTGEAAVLRHGPRQDMAETVARMPSAASYCLQMAAGGRAALLQPGTTHRLQGGLQ